MAVPVNAVAVAAFSLAQETLRFLNQKQIIVNEDLDELLNRAMNPLLASEGGPELNAEAGQLIEDVSRGLLPQRESRRRGQ